MKTAEQIEKILRSNVGLSTNYDFTVSAVGADWAEIHVPFAENLTRLGGTISGPVMMTAADTAMYAVVVQVAEHGEFGVTSHMNIEFLRRPPAAPLKVRATVLRAGRRQVSCAVSISSVQDERLVAHVTGAYVLFDAASKAD